MEPNLQHQLPAWIPTWEDLRDQEVEKAKHEAAIELAHLAEVQQLKQARLEVVERQIGVFGESEARVRAHQTQARWWFGLATFAVLVTVAGLWMGVEWFVSALWAQLVLTGGVFVLSIIGGTMLLATLAEQLPEEQLRRVFACLGVVIILCGLAAAVTFGIGRMMAQTVAETERQSQLIHESDDLGSNPATPSATLERVQAVARRLEQLAVLWGILLAVAGDLGTLIAVHQWMRHRQVVRTVEPVLREFRELGEELAEIARRQEEVRRWPELRSIELTLAGYRQEQARAARAEAERTRQETQRMQAAERAAKHASLAHTIKWTLIWFGAAMALLVFTVIAWAGTSEIQAPTTVVVLDLSSSADANAEFARNLQAIESLIRRLPVGGARLVVLGVTEASFSAPTLITLSSPRSGGRLGEYLASWQEGAVRQWRTVAKTLAPNAKGSDLFGALARAAVELAEVPSGPKHLIILSDMRQVGRGYDFERSVSEPVRLTGTVERAGLIPRLEHVEVWVLGAHTAGIDERHWGRLKAFWLEYFRRAGARIETFSPNRRFREAS